MSHREWILHPVLFNISINDLDDGSECLLSKFADDTELGEVIDTPVTATQTVLDRLEKCAERNLIKFHKGKCKVLHFVRNNPMHQYTLGNNWLESSFAEKDLEFLFDSKLSPQGRPTGSWTTLGRVLPVGRGE